MIDQNAKILLILGSNSDVGKACAHRFAAAGFDLILAARNTDSGMPPSADELASKYHTQIKTVYFDALKPESHEAFYASLEAKPLVVISTFGYLGDQQQAESDFAEAALISNTNYLGNVSILHLVAMDMETRKSGTIIGISSVAGERGRKSNYVYGASKAAFTTFLSGLRSRLLGANVHVATIIPGFIQTKMIQGISTPSGLTASPDQVAKAVWKAYEGKKNVVYVLPIWRWIMFIIKFIPEFVFKKLNL